MNRETGKLRVVKSEPVARQLADLSYEWKDRQRIRARNWAAVHIAADRREPVSLSIRRFWRR